MLELILGLSGSGKSSLLLQRIRARAEAGQRSLLLVPEQFTSSTESRLYRALGDSLSGWVDSYSFTSLAEHLLNLYGGAARPTLTDPGRAVLVRRALESLGEQVQLYHRHRRSAAFCALCAETIDELKSAGLDGPRLAQLAVGAGEGAEKLTELALIFSAYEALLAGTGMDPGDRVEAAARGLEPDFLADTAVFVDEFDTFNAPKKALLRAILRFAPQVCVTLCADGYEDGESGMGLFSGAKAVAHTLTRMARQEGIECAAPRVLAEDARHRDGLGPVNRLLAGVPVVPGPVPGLTLLEAASRAEEAKAAVAGIRRLARQGVAYGEMAIICRTQADYLPLIRYEAGLAGVPLFCDAPTTAEHAAPARAVRAALALLRGGLATEPLLTLAKSGLCTLPEAAQCALENYAYTWQLHAADWRAPFTRPAAGFGDKAEGDDEQLALAEQARAFLLARVEPFRQKCRGADARTLSRELYFLLDALGAPAAMQAQAEGLRAVAGLPAEQQAVREWNLVMDLLDQMARLLGSDECTPGEYDELFCLLVRTADLGQIPQTLDAVIFTDAGRMRLDNPQYCFVLGLCEGEFPTLPGEPGLLTHADRDALIRQGVEMPDCFDNRAIREQVCFYKALTAPAKGLWLSWPGGAGLARSAALAPLVDTFAPPPPVLTAPDYAGTPAAALDYLGAHWQDTPGAAALLAALEEQGELTGALDALRRTALGQPFAAADTAAMGAVLGSIMRLSPSRVERYYNCPFSYFLQYVLRIKPRRRADMTPDISGTLVHWVLEQALAREKENFAQLPPDTLDELAAQLVDEYVQANMPGAGVRFGYLVARLRRSVAQFLHFVQAEQQQGLFRPAALELEIGDGPGALPPLQLHTPDGHTVRLVGKIDRVDLLQKDGQDYLRVLDYKTGVKNFRLEDVYYGLDCQMLIYLFTLVYGGQTRFAAPQPAGVLYLMADPAPDTTTREKAQAETAYQTDGLLLADPEIAAAMDADGSGRFAPVKRKKSGEFAATAKVADLEKLGRIRQHLDELVLAMAQKLYAGEIAAQPLCRQESRPCQWCDYVSVCCHKNGRQETQLARPAHLFEAPEP